MKDFIKYTLATIVGIVLASIIFTVIGIVSVAGMVASENAGNVLEKNSILRIKLQGEITERTEENPMDFLSRGEIMSIPLDKALEALKKAATNDRVKGIYLEGGVLTAAPAELQELRQALLGFKESGKWIVAYGDEYSRGSYYLCSVADEVFLNPIGMLDWSGMSSQPIFYTGLMKKLGVKMQVFKVGTYKSAVEPFICTEMSDANREQVQSFLDNIWGNMLKEVAASRQINPGELNAMADSTTFLSQAEVFVKNKLVDKLGYLSDVKKALKQRLELDEDDDLNFATLADVIASDGLGKKIDDEVAVYYAYGEIADSRAAGFSQEHNITAKEMMKDLQELREDDDVKAVVIRVNSPGGSAYASEQIWHELQLLRAKKPVVVSMGGMAASGGYYISCGANQIFAEPMTLTGSIGIFGMIPDASELLTQKLGLTFDVVKTNAMSDFGAMGRPFNANEAAKMQGYVNRGYELFTSRVADGRGMEQDSVKAIAEGRVWTGEQALSIGLVDKLGNLNDAVEAAALLAELEDYTVGRYPQVKPWYASLVDRAGSNYMDSRIRAAMGEYYPAYAFVKRIGKVNPIQARLPFDPNIK
ncbi:MAG: signal peptide peptidase SppA [Prevotellaceae bacterium]|nr:signal peptide peptidase SppA [Prevotellaceae bacterium]